MANEVRLIDENVLYGMLEWDNDIERYTLRGLEFGDEIPTIDPESLRPQGRWVNDGVKVPNGVDWYHCSECGKWDVQPLTNYCPDCGADMRGVDDGK